MERVVLIGAGDSAEFVTSTLDDLGVYVDGFIDERKGGFHMEKPIMGSRIEDISDFKSRRYFITISEPKERKRWFQKLKELGVETFNVIDPTAVVSKDLQIGTGNYIGKMTFIGCHASIGDNNMIVSTAVIEHHCTIGSHNRIAPAAVLNGNVVVEDGVFVGSNSCCIGDQTIGEGSTIGAGSVVLKDVKPGTTVVGIPARKIRKNNLIRKRLGGNYGNWQ